MEATVTQPPSLGHTARHRSIRKDAMALLGAVIQAVAVNARGEAYDRVLSGPDVGSYLGGLPRSEQEALLAAGRLQLRG